MKSFYSTHHKLFLLKKIKLILIAVLLSSLSLTGIAQGRPGSAYSRFGLGMQEITTSTPLFGMGGISSIVGDPYHINLSNPASYPFLDLTSLQINIKGGSMLSTTADASASTNYGQINEMAMVFKKPLSPWAFAISIGPYSQIDYKFRSQEVVNDSLTANYIYEGNGGLNKATIGLGRSFKFTRQSASDSTKSERCDSLGRKQHTLSFGVNANYIFGNISREGTAIFNLGDYYSSINTVNLWTSGFNYQAGFQYRVNLTTKRDEKCRVTGGSTLLLGADYTMKGNLYAEYSEFIHSIRIISSSVFRDTSLSADGQTGRLMIPSRLSFGAGVRFFGKNWGSLLVGFDYKMQNWSEYKLSIPTNANLDKGLKASTTSAIGLEYRPNTDVSSNFLHRAHYRVGIRSTMTPLELNGERVMDEAFSFGLTIPVVKSTTRFFIGTEIGRRGSTGNGLVQEDYLNAMIGITLTPSAFDRWFRQVKYD